MTFDDVTSVWQADDFEDMLSIDTETRDVELNQISQTPFFQRLQKNVAQYRSRRTAAGKEKAELAEIISIHSFRGGTGKSNITANFASALAGSGYRVCVVDTDVQSPGIHVLFGLDSSEPQQTLNSYLWGECGIEQTAIDVTPAMRIQNENFSEGGSLFLVPSSMKTGDIARGVRDGYDVALLNDGFRDLIRHLELDYLLIDTHPGVNDETLLSIAISDVLLLILRPDKQDFQGTSVAVELARRLETPRMMLLLNKVPPDADFVALRERVETAYEAPVAAVFPLSIEMVQVGSAGLFCLRYPMHLLSREVSSLTKRIQDPVDALVKHMKSTTSPFREMLREIHGEVMAIRDGEVADYIPELTRVDLDWLGLSVVTTDGHVFETGDSKQTFTLQSCSKPFTYGMALEDRGRQAILERIGVEPSGDAFNSIELDQKTNRPFNPMVNPGAIATTDLIQGADLPDRLNRMLAMFSRYTGHPVQADTSVFLSERSTGHRNRAIANLMLNFGMVGEEVEESLELYFQQCSLMVSAVDLATMGATLANGGKNPSTGEQALSAEYTKDVLCVMYTCGMYDFAGEWGHEVGLPAKSGVSGGIVVVVPGLMGIGVYSPRVDSKGTSVRGLEVCKALSERLNLHVFESMGLRTTLDDLVGKAASQSRGGSRGGLQASV